MSKILFLCLTLIINNIKMTSVPAGIVTGNDAYTEKPIIE